MPRLCARFSIALLSLHALAFGSVSHVRAYDEQASADVALGYVHVAPGGALPASGTELTVGAGYGLGDMFVLRSSLGYGLQIETGRSESVGRARVEVAYLLDVLSVVPFFGGGASAFLFSNDGFQVAPAGHLLVGGDWLITREWTAGLDVRIGMFAVARDVFSATEAQLRLSRMFDLL